MVVVLLNTMVVTIRFVAVFLKIHTSAETPPAGMICTLHEEFRTHIRVVRAEKEWECFFKQCGENI